MKGEFEWSPKSELKSLAALPRLIERPQPPKTEQPKQTHPTYSYHEPVVNSTHVKWKPIDIVAARVVAPAKDISLPPQPPPTFMSKTEYSKVPEQVGGIQGMPVHKKLNPESGVVEEMYATRDVLPVAVDGKEQHTKENLDRVSELLRRIQDAYETIEYLNSNFRPPAEEAVAFLRAQIATVRDARIALQSETRTLIASLREVREFFLGDNHQAEVTRLVEFVSLCERLQNLKESGFLDAISDTILKLDTE